MNLVGLAMRIRDLRKKRGLTLEQLAERSGLTRSVLSKVENFRVTPSLPALGRIAKALQVSVAEIFEGLDEKPELVVVRKNERTLVERDRPKSKIRYEALAHKRQNKAMEPFLVQIPPGNARKEALTHEGEEFLLVLSGEIDLEYGDTVVHLGQDDAAYFEGSVKHRLVNKQKLPADLLIVYCAAI